MFVGAATLNIFQWVGNILAVGSTNREVISFAQFLTDRGIIEWPANAPFCQRVGWATTFIIIALAVVPCVITDQFKTQSRADRDAHSTLDTFATPV